MGSQPQPRDLLLLPWPVSVDLGAGRLSLPGAGFELEAPGGITPRLQRAVARLERDVAVRTGLPASDGAAKTTIRLSFAGPARPVPGIHEDESYWLVVDDAGLYLDAASEWGALHGLQTLGQLVTPEGEVPHLAVDDRPRFPWRGLLLDPARHFLPLADLLRTLDGMARCKLNVLHLHLSDDQGFRFPVPALPKLASREAYSETELSTLVARAADLGIRVVPEIDMPGHVTSWLTAYPELGSRHVEPADGFGVHEACLDPASEAVYTAIGHILDALVAVFPDPCLHIGGDEVSPAWWSEDPGVAALMAREGLTDIRAVQGYFNRRVGALVAARDRQVLAWDEVLDAGGDGRWVIQAWRGSTLRDRALAAGARVVVSAPYYLDLNYPADVHYGFDPAAPQQELLDREDALRQDVRLAHVAAGLDWTDRWRQGALSRPPEADDALLLGAEACLWGELVTPENLDVRLWSRLPALAERFWSAPEIRDAAWMYRRMDGFLARDLPLAGIDLDAISSAHLARLGVDEDWRELVAMLEPVKWYARLLGSEAMAGRLRGEEMPRARPYTLASPLDGLADHLFPESRRARAVAALCGRAWSGDEAARSRLLETLGRWAALGQAAGRAPQGLEALARRLAALGEAIRRRLDGEPLTREALVALAAPEGELMLGLPRELAEWLTST